MSMIGVMDGGSTMNQMFAVEFKTAHLSSPAFAIKPPKELMCSPSFEGLIFCSYLDNSSILSFSRYSAPTLISSSAKHQQHSFLTGTDSG